MDVCKDCVQQDDFEAKVINLDMLREAINGEDTVKKSGRKSALVSTRREEHGPQEIDFDSVEQLILTVKGIYRIDHLWILPNLTDLNLSCNNIQFIENLNCLPNLVKLNLACNQIKKIEQIDQLLQLEIFMIHNNRISVLENFHASKRLKMFNIRNNVIEDLEESVLYLRKFKGLKSLCITGNPCCDKVDSIESYLIAYLPQLVYVEYHLITKTEQEKHRAHYAADIERLELEELKINEANGKEETDERLLSDQKLAFVENLNKHQLFELMQDRDPYSHIMLLMKGDIYNIYERYQQEFFVYTQQLFQMGIEEYENRNEDIKQFNETFEKLKAQVNNKNRQIVEDFISKKAFIFYDIAQIIREIEQTDDMEPNDAVNPHATTIEIEHKNGNQKKLEIDNINKEESQGTLTNLGGQNNTTEKKPSEDMADKKHTSFDGNGDKNKDKNDKMLALNEIFHDTCNKTYDDLMRNEDVLHEQLMDLISTLDKIYLDNHVDNFIRKAQLLFTNLRDVNKTYMEIIKEHSKKFFNKNIGNPAIPAQLRQILDSADTLANALDTSERAQLDTIDEREETMLTNIRQWHQQFLDNLTEEEIRRHRKCVNELCHLIDINREELDDIVNDVALVDPELLT